MTEHLVVRNATIVLSDETIVGDLSCRGGVIEAITQPWAAAVDESTEEIDATGLHVLPGVIDPHVHARDPGQKEKELFHDLSLSAAAGGVTTMLVMPNTLPPVVTAADLEARTDYYSPLSVVDYALWSMMTSPPTADQLRDLRAAGAVGIKVFWGYAVDRKTGALVYNPGDRPADEVSPPPTNGDLWTLFRAAADTGLVVALHCEDRAVMDTAFDELGELNTYDDLLASRPIEAESMAVSTVVELSRATGTKAHVLHISTGLACQLIEDAQQQGVPITGETCPQYLVLSSEDYDELGPMMKVYPPIRDKGEADRLWQAVTDRTIPSVGSDHAPHSTEEKCRDLTNRPAGIIGVETLVQLMAHEVTSGRLTLQEMVYSLSEGTAKLYDLYPRKGSLMPGSDADLTILDLAETWEIREADLHATSPVGAWSGRKGQGNVKGTVVRGRVVMWGGELLQTDGGTFVPAGQATPAAR